MLPIYGQKTAASFPAAVWMMLGGQTSVFAVAYAHCVVMR